jgi:tungstate transport system substrate-binding protein
MLLFALATAIVAGCGSSEEVRPVILATTTSTDNSGLLAEILPPFEEKEGVRVKVLAVGTGEALAYGRRGDADLLLVHARSREDEFVANGWGIDRRDIMWNDFVIAGPGEDPAGISDAPDAAEAFRRIAAAEATFISRGDDSGTHTRERILWKAAGIEPGWDGYKDAGQGMGACLTLADELGAYVLTDRGTFLAYGGKVHIAILFEGDPALRNPYGAILVNPEKHPDVNVAGARKLLDYLTSKEGQERIGAFRVNGKQLFHPGTGE